MLLRYNKRMFSAYSGPVMLISRKVIKDRRAVTDLRYLNIRNAKTNLVYPLLKDTFIMLGSSRSKILSVLNLNDTFYSLRLSKNSKRFCGILPYFGSALSLYQRMLMRVNISPAICQCCISASLDCLQSRNLLLFNPIKKKPMAKLKIC